MRGSAQGGGRGDGARAPTGGKSASRAYIELNQQITRLGSAGELCELIEARSAEFNHVNVSTAFRKLLSAGRAGVHPTARSTALHKLEKCAMSTMADSNSQGVANILHIVAKTRHRPSNHEFLATLDARVEEVARECNSQGVANTLWAYATMGRRPGERVLGALDARVEAVARECNSQDVANTLWAYATMGRRPGERVLGALEARVEEVARECNSQEVANTLWAYATMGRRPGERVLEVQIGRAHV